MERRRTIKFDHGNYAFGYQIKDPWGASNSREESGDAHGGKTGSYSLQDSDGRSRTVKYWADKSGFRAKIMSNEPSVISHEAADASYSGSDGGKGHGGGSYSYGGGQGGKW
ncbi:unnamed protein product [Oppiella nova]|uniref:Uncharacterized protein n=1 Tax=Oppiella nova TaxID=334625 RepID=A0A7R9MSV6_9ACAR|nr:unnamed protein product [Oppiella nova]CAG2182326.1 unnamed protein product [Oppiella nova]